MKKRIIITIVIIILIIIFAIGGAYLYTRSKIAKINQISINPEVIVINKGVEDSIDNYRNIALLGIDSTVDGYGMGNRSDCIIIASLNKKTNEVKLVSVYRDTYLEIEGRGLDKVNHAYCFGGPELAMNTLNTNLDLNIKEFVVVNFNTVANAVNALGGVEIDITDAEMKYINGNIKDTAKRTGIKSTTLTHAGKQTLDGIQAMGYSRIRYTEGLDYKRTERMRTVLLKMFEKLKTKGMSESLNILNELLPELSTNISVDEMISLLPKLANFNVAENIGWPYDTKGYDVNGPWYGPPVTLESNVIRLHKEIFAQENYTPTQTVKEISQKIIDKTGYDKM